MNTELKNAVNTLIEELSKDKSEGSYYYSWQANIAMAFKDEFYRETLKGHTGNNVDVHKVANQAAKNFLDLLIK